MPKPSKPMPKQSSANDPAMSPEFAGLDALAPFAPIALALLAGDGPLEQYGRMKDALRRRVDDDPMDALLATVLGGGLAFYLAERETNPACQSPWDGIVYAATCLSVGYDNLFPMTSTGHALAALIQTFGPGLAAKAFDPTAAEKAATEAVEAAEEERARGEVMEVNRAILARLEDIVRLLEAKG